MFQSPHFKIMVWQALMFYMYRCLSDPYYTKVGLALLYVCNSEETKYIMFCVIVQDTSSLLLSACSTKENAMTELLLAVT